MLVLRRGARAMTNRKPKKERTPTWVKNIRALNYQDAMNTEYRIHGKSERWFALREKMLAEVR
jgi:hypothetical protein